ncbi:Serine/threonine-protein phosphatase 6 regulatory ankyrin repeat subunit A [Saguinus oedipus]|uniref:Serine/threonine-protein phosphatase 6 regulatory ankyrin repeat subunit A n=1 Tax=Saguinus oedipus TaxID=9490 RepID=A0ABQ9U0E5_SAGOE|nr:Serine/threonine-protein phosphatase 6 regulatory ankyrin repeat subunit A [Saguinus oedipus]
MVQLCEAVQVLLKHSADVNARDKNWQTPLHIAAANKAVKCAEALVPLLSNVNVSDRAGRTALHHAAFSGHGEMVKLLLSRGANINAFDKKDRRAIHWAAYMDQKQDLGKKEDYRLQGHIEVVKLLVSHGAEVTCKDKKSYTPLHAAASSGMISVVKYLLDLGVDPLSLQNEKVGNTRFTEYTSESSMNEPNAYGNTPLHVACYNGQDVVVNELIDCGAIVNQKNEKGFTPLHFAAASTHGALCLELLVGNGADVNMKFAAKIMGAIKSCIAGAVIDCEDKNGNTPLHIAARYGHELLINTLITSGADTAKNLECLNLLLNTGADFNKKDKFGRSPLHYAAANCNYQCLFALVGSGASVNDLDERGCTPLHYAATSDTDGNVGDVVILETFNKECLEYLLRNDANPGIRDKQGYNAVHYSAAYGHRLCLQLLMETSGTDMLSDSDNRATISPLHLADNLVQLYEEGNFSLKDLQCYSCTARTMPDNVAYHGHHQALEVLVQSLLDLDVRNSSGRTPLDLAAFKGHVECVDVLINQGASILVKDYVLKRTPIHAAVRPATNGHSECLRLLIGNAEPQNAVDIQDGNGQTPLMLSVLNGHTDCVYSLLNKGANVDAKDKWGRTALHRGAVTGHEECVDALLQHGAKCLLRDSRGRTPIHLSAACGHIGVLGALLQSAASMDANPAIADNHGYTALHWACYNGHETCVELLLEQEVFQKTEGNAFSPLHCAVINDNEGAAEMLIDTLGSSIVNTTDSKGRTPLHAAAFTDHVECLQLLLSHNAQVNSVDSTGKTPLMMAAENGQTNTVEMLVSSASADLTLQDNSKNTALHLACSKGHETSALLILEKITDRNLINATNAALQTPLHVAARNGLTMVVQELLGKGASVLAVDENGYTPALACAPNKDVADCLALILATMMPVSSSSPLSSLTFNAINRYTNTSKTVSFEALPIMRNEPSSYCSFNNIGGEQEYLYTDVDELNDSDSETY